MFKRAHRLEHEVAAHNRLLAKGVQTVYYLHLYGEITEGTVHTKMLVCGWM